MESRVVAELASGGGRARIVFVSCDFDAQA
jgi:hypothetical protein